MECLVATSQKSYSYNPGNFFLASQGFNYPNTQEVYIMLHNNVAITLKLRINGVPASQKSSQLLQTHCSRKCVPPPRIITSSFFQECLPPRNHRNPYKLIIQKSVCLPEIITISFFKECLPLRNHSGVPVSMPHKEWSHLCLPEIIQNSGNYHKSFLLIARNVMKNG